MAIDPARLARNLRRYIGDGADLPPLRLKLLLESAEGFEAIAATWAPIARPAASVAPPAASSPDQRAA